MADPDAPTPDEPKPENPRPDEPRPGEGASPLDLAPEEEAALTPPRPDPRPPVPAPSPEDVADDGAGAPIPLLALGMSDAFLAFLAAVAVHSLCLSMSLAQMVRLAGGAAWVVGAVAAAVVGAAASWVVGRVAAMGGNEPEILDLGVLFALQAAPVLYVDLITGFFGTREGAGLVKLAYFAGVAFSLAAPFILRRR